MRVALSLIFAFSIFLYVNFQPISVVLFIFFLAFFFSGRSLNAQNQCGGTPARLCKTRHEQKLLTNGFLIVI